MFTDIVGSTSARDRFVTEYGEVNGDSLFRSRVLDRHNSNIRNLLQLHRGYEVKTNGDSFMASFDSPSDAVSCASEIQRMFRGQPIEMTDGPLSVRIGLHTSQPTLRQTPAGWDYDGHAVNIAARIEGLLRGGGQILCSDITYELAKGLPGVRFHRCGKYPLKGVREPVDIYEVLWHDDQSPNPPTRPIGLPYPWLTPWIRRELPQMELKRALLSEKLITLHGQGGVGKTRLAVETLIEVRTALPTELVFVPLADRTNQGAELLSALRDALGSTAADVPDWSSLRAKLENGEHLLLLDNFESVMQGAPYLPQLATIRGTTILLTTQQVLGAVGECVVHLDPMPTEGELEELDSYRLLVTLAQRRNSNWRPEDKESLRRILQLSEGIPYIIEILAGSVSRKSLREIVDEYEAQVISLASRARDDSRPSRHDSVRACLEWAMDHLSAPQREALILLSVFPGSFDTEAAAAVCHTSPQTLADLIEASLLRRDDHDSRYSMLVTTRQGAFEKLQEDAEPLRRKHAEWYIDKLERTDRTMADAAGARLIAAKSWIATERANLSSAIDWADTHDSDLFRRGVGALTRYLELRSDAAEMLRLNLRLGERLTSDAPALYWARQKNDLGRAYWKLPLGDRVTNNQTAIDCYHVALAIYSEMRSPQEWAAVQNNLGLAYWSRTIGNPSENLLKAISHYEAALQIFNERDFATKWAWTQNNMGLAYMSLPTGDLAENLRKAMDCYHAALRVYTERDYPDSWARTQNNLGGVYWNLPSGVRDENLRRAIEHVTAALRVFTEFEYPVDWAKGEFNVAVAYTQLLTGDREENIERAILHCEASMRVYTRENFPFDWSTANSILGVSYMNRETGNRRANLERAVTFFTTALQGLPEEEYPADWAMTQDNLGATLVMLVPYVGDEPALRAIAAFEAALRVRTRDAFPREWAITQDNLGCAYRELGGGNASKNLLRAVTCFNSALEVFSEKDFTAEWARTQKNLAVTYERFVAAGRRTYRARAAKHYASAAHGFASSGYTDEANAAQAKAASLRTG
jgi:class 3 adenylate cyclase/predicted ATPase